MEAKESERPDRRKLNFNKIAPLFKEEVRCIVSCNIQENRIIKLEDFEVYNPLKSNKTNYFNEMNY